MNSDQIEALDKEANKLPAKALKELYASIPTRAVLSLIFHFSTLWFDEWKMQQEDTSELNHKLGGAGWEMVELGIPPDLAYDWLDHRDGLLFGTSLMTPHFDKSYSDEGDPCLNEFMNEFGGPISVTEARVQIKQVADNWRKKWRIK